MNNILDFYETQRKLSERLNKVFGSDTSIFIRVTEEYIEDTVDLYGTLMGNSEAVDWLFWESMMSHTGLMSFFVDGVEYEGNPENVYDDIKGNLGAPGNKGGKE